MPFLNTIKRFTRPKLIKSVTIELSIRENKLDGISETLFAAREIVKLGFAKNAEAMPWGIRAFNVPTDRLNDLKRHAESMGANRWWIAD
jgi:hypothetical protein